MLRFVGRLIWVPISFVVSALIGAAVLFSLGSERLLQEIASQRGTSTDSIDIWLGYFDQAWLIANIASALTIVPPLLMVIIGEVARIQSSIFYVLGGGAALAVVPLLAKLVEAGGADITLPSATLFQVFATAGFAAGFVYWLICGRTA